MKSIMNDFDALHEAVQNYRAPGTKKVEVPATIEAASVTSSQVQELTLDYLKEMSAKLRESADEQLPSILQEINLEPYYPGQPVELGATPYYAEVNLNQRDRNINQLIWKLNKILDTGKHGQFKIIYAGGDTFEYAGVTYSVNSLFNERGEVAVMEQNDTLAYFKFENGNWYNVYDKGYKVLANGDIQHKNMGINPEYGGLAQNEGIPPDYEQRLNEYSKSKSNPSMVVDQRINAYTRNKPQQQLPGPRTLPDYSQAQELAQTQTPYSLVQAQQQVDAYYRARTEELRQQFRTLPPTKGY